jgi:hypothetical protein
MRIIDNASVTGPVELRLLHAGQVFKFVDEDSYGSMYHMVIQNRIVELEDAYESYDRDAFQYAYVIVYDATLQVTR